jgi:hypothetical protein
MEPTAQEYAIAGAHEGRGCTCRICTKVRKAEQPTKPTPAGEEECRCRVCKKVAKALETKRPV